MPVITKQTLKGTTKKKLSAWDRISGIEQTDHDIKITLWGRSGSGKTTLWSTFPKPILALICSGGKETRSVKNVKGIEQVYIETSADITEIAKKQAATSRFKTVVLDHATDFQALILKEILGLDELPAQGSWGMASQGQWGQCSLQTKERLRELLDLENCHTVIVAQERDFKSDGESEILTPSIGAGLTPQTAGWLNTACEYIVQTFIKERTIEKEVKLAGKISKTVQKVKDKVDFCLRTAPHPVYITKFRVPKNTPLPTYIVDPNFDKILKLINGQGG